MADESPPRVGIFEGLRMNDDETPKLSNKGAVKLQQDTMPGPPPLLEDSLLGTLVQPTLEGTAITDPTSEENETEENDADKLNEEEAPESAVVQEIKTQESNTTSYYSGFMTSWFGGANSTTKQAEKNKGAEPKEGETTITEEQQETSPTEIEHTVDQPDETPTPEEPATTEESPTTNSKTMTNEEHEPAATIPLDTTEETNSRKELDEVERKHLDDAFQDSSKHHKPRGWGPVHADTPIPNCDAALRILRRFAYKTRPKIISTYGGSKSRSILTYLFGSSKEDPTYVPYRELMDVLFDQGEDRDMKDDSDRLVDSVLGEPGDSMARARLAVAWFVFLFSQWGHASSRFFENKDLKSQKEFSDLLLQTLEAASNLVAHGCLDGVMIVMGDVATEMYPAVHMLAQSVFNADLTLEQNELHAMKFLLGAGCRITADNEALLHGSHLLQTIRLLYHVYLTTESVPNKTTARASLQQIVSSVFSRMVKTDKMGHFKATEDHFPSNNHRDAFLVLRSICKLSMRNLPDPKTGLHSHVGLQSSGSNDAWDYGNRDRKSSYDEQDNTNEAHEHATLVYTAAIHPALESKILALELILYVLQNTEFSRGFIQRSGPQFHAAIRNYLCVSLLKNCTSDDTHVVNLSLRIFVPLVRNFRVTLKNEIEAFVTNVFFVILDSKNSPAEHKSIVVNTFDEICSDPATLAEIFLNYDCDLSAQDLFHRIVDTLSKVSMTGIQEPKASALSFMGGSSATRMEKFRNETRELRLDAMRALRQVLASLHASIVQPMPEGVASATPPESLESKLTVAEDEKSEPVDYEGLDSRQNLVEIYGSKKKRRAEESEAILRFNQKPSAGIAYAAKCGHINSEDPVDVARYLLKNKDVLDKSQIGEYLGREPEYQEGFSLKVLHEYVRLMDFSNLLFDEAIRFFLSSFRLPGEAQKIDRIMEKFAERYTEQNHDVFPTADVAFILAFSVIMLQTDLHNPAIKEDRRMTKEGFIRNNRGICDGKDLPEDFLADIYDRIKINPFSLKEDDEARERVGDLSRAKSALPLALNPTSFFSSHYDEMDRARESNFQKERDHIVRTTESLLKRRRYTQSQEATRSSARIRPGKQIKNASKFVITEDSGLRDEYVSPMFEQTWGPALAAFSTAMESANGTVGALISIASDEELEMAAENAAETIEVCLTGFRFAICTAGLCGNDTARDAYMLALSRFSQLGTGGLLEPRHVRCIQTMLSLAREDGELLGSSWEHVFVALSEINRFHQLFQLMARNDRAAAAAAARRRRRMEEKDKRRKQLEARKAAAEDGDSIVEYSEDDYLSEVDSLAESDLFPDEDGFLFEDEMDAKAVDEANARVVYDAVSETLIEAIYERSSSLSAHAVKDFVIQLCLVSRSEISVGNKGGLAVHGSGQDDLTKVSYRQQHALLEKKGGNGPLKDQFHRSQPNIYNLQKLVEVTHYNMHSRPRMIFADLWSIVADHLTYAALHPNPALAMYAVDSFRQLSIQYLQREELEVFEFQRRFLKPLENIMAKSSLSSTKELLLDCVGRIIRVFNPESSDAGIIAEGRRKGGLRSGWMPILTILGFGGSDRDANVSAVSFKILTGEIKYCLDDPEHECILLSEHFVETVEALFKFVNGPHKEKSLLAIDQLMLLIGFLSDDSSSQPQLKRKATVSAIHGTENNSEFKEELELWWPILLGLSEACGDSRLDVRLKALKALVTVINDHFFPDKDNTKHSLISDRDDSLQTLRLIFRGILTPILENAEVGSDDDQSPAVPKDFQRFTTKVTQPKPGAEEAIEEVLFTGWLDTTFDLFMDACISICLRATTIFNDGFMVEEVLSILNSCLLSDSGSLAVRGLHRLEQFITSDLDDSALTDDLWAAVSHMLRRCITLRGLPIKQEPSHPDAPGTDLPVNDTAIIDPNEEEYNEAVREFMAEDNLLNDRRYIGSVATSVVGMLLTSDRFSSSMGLRWRLFLVTGLSRGIQDWEHAAALTAASSRKKKPEDGAVTPPDYLETALYGRKWMNRFILQLASSTEVAQISPDEDVKSNRFAAAQKLILGETEHLLVGFLEKEKAVDQYRHTELDEILHEKFTGLVKEMLTGLSNMDADHLQRMSWLNDVLLNSCIQSKNADIRHAVQKLVQRTSPPPTAYPAPPKPKPPPSENENTLLETRSTEEEAEFSVPEQSPYNEGVNEDAASEDEDVITVDEKSDDSNAQVEADLAAREATAADVGEDYYPEHGLSNALAQGINGDDDPLSVDPEEMNHTKEIDGIDGSMLAVRDEAIESVTQTDAKYGKVTDENMESEIK